MKHSRPVLKYQTMILLVAGIIISAARCSAQNEFGKEMLKLEKEIQLPGVKGRIDHIDVDTKNQVAYVAALGNNTLEVVDLKTGKVTASIRGLDEPQGVAYISKHQEIFVANGGTGECYFFSSKTLAKTGNIKYSGDADDVRYDIITDKIYVGYGSGGIAIIDGQSHKQIGDIKLPAHPESFQLDNKAGKLWVNLPGAGIVGVVDLKKQKLIARWSKLFPRSNFPMAYDALQHRVIVGYRLPAKLIVYNSETGKESFSGSMVGDVDDLYWDKNTKQIYISGGGGAVNIFKQTGDTSYQRVAIISTRNGARTSLLVPELGDLLVAAKAEGEQSAVLLVYKTNP